MSEIVDIRSRDYWVKVVGMLEQNWALIEINDAASLGVRIFFVGDTGGVTCSPECIHSDGESPALMADG